MKTDETKGTYQPTTLEWLIASGQEITEEVAQQVVSSQKYKNRDKIPEYHLWRADLYNELTDQEPLNHVYPDWIQTFDTWQAEAFQPEHIKAAWEHASGDHGFFVGRPSALTSTARAMKSKMKTQSQPKLNTQAIEATRQAVDQKWSGNFVPRPAHIERPKNLPPSKPRRSLFKKGQEPK